MNVIKRAYAPLFQLRTWSATLHLLVNLALGVAWFTVAVTMFSLSLGLMITLIGIPLLVATINFGRFVGVVERKRALLLGEQLEPFPRQRLTGSFWNKSKTVLADGAGWRGLAFSILDLPWGIITFTATVVVWSVAASMAVMPTLELFLPLGDDEWGAYQFGDDYVLYGWGRFGTGVGVTILGLLLLAAAPRIIRGIASADTWIVRSLLSPDPSKALEQRVEELTISRDASVEGASLELRRIERDLHDGAQQRLVGLAMDLGLAKERLAAGDDPERATELVTRAHDEAKQAITELRELVRGIHPSVLTDRGLDAALSALAARSTVPVDLDVHLAARPPAAIEAAAYFVVAESLANIAKHSQATRASVRVGETGGVLSIDIYDNGIGGAVEHPGGGLSGLRDRILAVEGTLRLSSPPGGPTLLAAELPCAS